MRTIIYILKKKFGLDFGRGILPGMVESPGNPPKTIF
jgi:hypothetical protein